MSLFNPSDVRAVADLIRPCYDADLVFEMYATVEGAFQELLNDTLLDEKVVMILVHQKHDEALINRALDDHGFLIKMTKANTLVNAFHRKFEGCLWRLHYCTNNHNTAGLSVILNNIGKAAWALNMKTPFAF